MKAIPNSFQAGSLPRMGKLSPNVLLPQEMRHSRPR